ncbi:hypothetical protein O6H91_06G024300 [Diphasiastrum complanatum]|uniref:Uncharacterized protein n=1 Tax=Diphasiastrum complanatum TaxID=34168 RepID=A0ACC2DCH0_DIPCM|nr:hypothetical protein O6H91_06G024300 [Diphasiastrum complanatum]
MPKPSPKAKIPYHQHGIFFYSLVCTSLTTHVGFSLCWLACSFAMALGYPPLSLQPPSSLSSLPSCSPTNHHSLSFPAFSNSSVAILAAHPCPGSLSSCSSITLCGSSFGSLIKQYQTVKTCARTRSRLSTRCESGEASGNGERVPFGYTRKDVILIGVGLTVVGVGLKYGLELFGLDSLRAGNVVQLVMVLGLTVGWISTYVFRVSTKEMTYAKQLKDYEKKVMEKRLEELPEAELEALLAQVEEDKRRLQQSQKKP